MRSLVSFLRFLFQKVPFFDYGSSIWDDYLLIYLGSYIVCFDARPWYWKFCYRRVFLPGPLKWFIHFGPVSFFSTRF